ncbi:Gamma-glutamylcyclotransferase [Gryllus bimaculatus]|nr:Gamma-glutamylcyclotransferase [Gryllus bimaculatus]
MQAVEQPPQAPPPSPPPSPPVEHQHAHDALEHGSTPGLWVFGYGSLCWHPGFEYEQSVTGYVRGWARRFWQGNTTHRGTEGKPGRVATLIEEKEGVVWGRAFAVTGDAALPYLDTRECRLGGYRTQLTTFHPGCCPERTLTALVYVALPCNALWLGDAPLPEMARQIVASRGPSGHNVEYILRLAAFMRHQAPDSPTTTCSPGEV